MNGTELGFAGIILLPAHLSVPLGYYSYLKWFTKPWDPWVLIVSAALTLWGALALRETMSLVLLLTYAIVLSASKGARSWVLQQLYLTLALIRTIYNRPVTW